MIQKNRKHYVSKDLIINSECGQGFEWGPAAAITSANQNTNLTSFAARLSDINKSLKKHKNRNGKKAQPEANSIRRFKRFQRSIERSKFV